MSGSSTGERQTRHFDIEAEARSRRLFVLLMVGFAVLAVLGGLLFGLWVVSPPDEAEPPPLPPKASTFETIVPIEPIEPLPTEETEPKPTKSITTTIKAELDDRDIRAGLGRAQGALDACAREHGALDGMRITIDFSVGEDGRAYDAVSLSPYTSTPLGRCVAEAVRNHARFRRSRLGRRDLQRKVTLHRRDL